MIVRRTKSLKGALYLRQNSNSVRGYSSSNVLSLNRIFVEKEELKYGVDGEGLTVSLQSPDERFLHMRDILKLKVGDVMKMGVLDVGITDNATVLSKTNDEVAISLGKSCDIMATPKPPVDLILAFPRPARLSWLFPVVSSLGIGRISLVRAAKTEKGYMASHYYRSKHDKLRRLLTLGLSQAATDCWMPKCDLYPGHIREFMCHLDELYPPGECLRLLAHPLKPRQSINKATYRRQLNNGLEVMSSVPCCPEINSVPFHDLQPPNSWIRQGSLKQSKKRVVIAVGPEGGWSDDEILDFHHGHNFVMVHMLGERVLRTDIAVPALLAFANEWYNKITNEN